MSMVRRAIPEASSLDEANEIELELSPYFLAVAQFKGKNGAARDKPIRWIHANGEDTGLPSQSLDIVSISYVVCEQVMEDAEGVITQRGMISLSLGYRELEYIAFYASVILDGEENVTDLPLDKGVRALLLGCQKLRRLAFYLAIE
ncbi:hypothetical protein Dimus_028720 [Dionaea muscipula]